ncbi:cyclopropane-fatty-acyl-phospholipid synthase [Candidatus Endobugula sertula]|uniref:Cyclopropane-fatty-acyl-phospholipid synthase n=1 Tax=Candidatus Endobugula sertula TaxID=62101 RepID=A0A1D2QMF4_9GAMM|nr:cyclopropane-fatty-acyl-phospholipid synthase [Candidatus Endobugula sertula]
MSTAGINSNIYREIKTSWLDGLAKRLVFMALSKLQQGRLVIDDNGKISVFGELQSSAMLSAHIVIHHPSVYRQLLFGGSIGSGQAYMLGTWSSPNLLNVIRLFCQNLDALNRMDSSRPVLNRIVTKLSHQLNRNTLSGSKRNIAAHYDLGNDFFKLFLDSKMMYSAGIYPYENASLEEAATHKLDIICKKLRLNQQDHLLEIGTGWGGLAIYAAKHYGCQVTTTTISQAQFNYAKQAVKQAGLEDKITLLLCDYRNLTGQFTKLVSVEMIEAVGHKHYKHYFSICSRLLKDDGLMCIQAITIADQRYEQAKQSVDFIQRYIFPGGSLPSNVVIAQCVARYTDMQIVNVEDIGLDYAKTLAHWRNNFKNNLPRIKKMGFDELFCRMWEFYLCYCEGGFLERSVSTVHTVIAKPGAKHLRALD